MRYPIPGLALAALIALVALNRANAQATINDCEKIQAADAYNQCLAKFGPSGKNLNMEPEKPSDMKSGSEDAAKTAGRLSHPGAHVGRRRGRGGHAPRRGAGGSRKRATFSVGQPKA